MTEYLFILTAVPDENKARTIAAHLVESKLAACVTVSAAARSVYRWEGKLREDREYVLFIKTKASLFKELEAALKAVHPYAVPEIIALPIVKGSRAYLDWIAKETKVKEAED
jgi:periplasmic divalent cation tolerance protein